MRKKRTSTLFRTRLHCSTACTVCNWYLTCNSRRWPRRRQNKVAIIGWGTGGWTFGSFLLLIPLHLPILLLKFAWLLRQSTLLLHDKLNFFCYFFTQFVVFALLTPLIFEEELLNKAVKFHAPTIHFVGSFVSGGVVIISASFSGISPALTSGLVVGVEQDTLLLLWESSDKTIGDDEEGNELELHWSCDESCSTGNGYTSPWRRTSIAWRCGTRKQRLVMSNGIWIKRSHLKTQPWYLKKNLWKGHRARAPLKTPPLLP